jgi:hypothetical protein
VIRKNNFGLKPENSLNFLSNCLTDKKLFSDNTFMDVKFGAFEIVLIEDRILLYPDLIFFNRLLKKSQASLTRSSPPEARIIFSSSISPSLPHKVFMSAD